MQDLKHYAPVKPLFRCLVCARTRTKKVWAPLTIRNQIPLLRNMIYVATGEICTTGNCYDEYVGLPFRAQSESHTDWGGPLSLQMSTHSRFTLCILTSGKGCLLWGPSTKWYTLQKLPRSKTAYILWSHAHPQSTAFLLRLVPQWAPHASLHINPESLDSALHMRHRVAVQLEKMSPFLFSWNQTIITLWPQRTIKTSTPSSTSCIQSPTSHELMSSWSRLKVATLENHRGPCGRKLFKW